VRVVLRELNLALRQPPHRVSMTPFEQPAVSDRERRQASGPAVPEAHRLPEHRGGPIVDLVQALGVEPDPRSGKGRTPPADPGLLSARGGAGGARLVLQGRRAPRGSVALTGASGRHSRSGPGAIA
jgi:hypothetical protein